MKKKAIVIILLISIFTLPVCFAHDTKIILGEKNLYIKYDDESNIVYRQIIKIFDSGSSNKFSSSVMVSIKVKMQKYHSEEFGDYEKFLEVLSVKTIGNATGVPTLKPIAVSTDITGESKYENQMVLLFFGDLETEINKKFHKDAEDAGYIFPNGTKNKLYCRKYIEINHRFDSNFTKIKGE